MRKVLLLILLVFLTAGYLVFSRFNADSNNFLTNEPQEELDSPLGGEMPEDGPHPLSIEALRRGDYPGSDITIEQTLSPGSNYQRYIASYRSEGLKIYGLLTVPNGDAPPGGWPAIIFNHGYIPPAQYRTTERYIAYTDGFSRNGYVLFRPDYRGHGNSEGQATGAYGSNGYTIDVLNALASVKKLRDPSVVSSQPALSGVEGLSIVDGSHIGMWGHSLGGFITLRSMVVSRDIEAGVIWAGVVGSYEDLFERWRRRNVPSGIPSTRGGSWRQQLSSKYGEPDENPEFWNSLSANSYLADISGPLQLHHGTVDSSVPVEFSEKLSDQMKAASKVVELYTYPGDDHDITSYFGTAMQRSIDFFNKHLK